MFDISSACVGGGLGLMVGIGFALAAGLIGYPGEKSIEGDLDPDLAEPVAPLACVDTYTKHLFKGRPTCMRYGCSTPNPYIEPVVATTEGQPMSEAAV